MAPNPLSLALLALLSTPLPHRAAGATELPPCTPSVAEASADARLVAPSGLSRARPQIVLDGKWQTVTGVVLPAVGERWEPGQVRAAARAADAGGGGLSLLWTGAGRANAGRACRQLVKLSPEVAAPSSSVWLVAGYVAALFLMVFLLHLSDSMAAYAYPFPPGTRRRLLRKVKKDSSPEQIAQVAREMATLGQGQAITGLAGTTRSIFAYGLVLIVGIAVFHLLVLSPGEKAIEFADKNVTALVAAVSTIIGFYFGSKATSEGARTATPAPAAAVPTAEIVTVAPAHAYPGERIDILGTGFGDDPGNVSFGAITANAADLVKWAKDRIQVNVPAACIPGPTSIVVNPTGGKKITAAEGLFTVDGMLRRVGVG